MYPLFLQARISDFKSIVRARLHVRHTRGAKGQIRDQIDQIAHFQLQSIVASPIQDPLGLLLFLFLFAQCSGAGR